MTGFINSMMSTSLKLRLITPLRHFHITPASYLYSHTALGIDSYLISRKRIKEQFASYSDKFKMKMNQFIEDPKNMIFTEDLKNMVHIAEPSDVELVSRMIKKFNTQKTEFRFGSFVFGPVAMRMFYFLDNPSLALETFLHEDNKGFFDQLVSFQILLDLLYNHEMYEEMHLVFDIVKAKQINMTKFPKYPVVLILAACYKQNSPQSLEAASKLWTEMTSVGNKPLRRASTLMAGLALNQNAPHVALEAISMQRQHYVTVRNIKAMALSDLDRTDDAINVLKSVLNIDAPEQKDKHTFSRETIMKVKEAVERSKDQVITKEYENVLSALENRNLIDDQKLETLLSAEITITPKKPEFPRGMPNRKMPYYKRNQEKSF